MTLKQQAHNAYATSSNPTKTNRALEYDIFARVTTNLRTAQESTKNFASTARSVDENRRLWALVAACASDPGNSLSEKLRAQLFYLFEFTTEHSKKILRGEANFEALIEINLSIMRGLKVGPVQ